jgi:hypothetical protein
VVGSASVPELPPPQAVSQATEARTQARAQGLQCFIIGSSLEKTASAAHGMARPAHGLAWFKGSNYGKERAAWLQHISRFAPSAAKRCACRTPQSSHNNWKHPSNPNCGLGQR